MLPFGTTVSFSRLCSAAAACYASGVTNQWYYARGGQRQGPIERSALEMLARTGELAPDDLVWTDGMADWAAARTIEGLFGVSRPPLPADRLNPYASPASMTAGVPAAAPGGAALEILDPPARLTVGGPLELAVKMLRKDFGMILLAGLVYFAVLFGASMIFELIGMASGVASGVKPASGNPQSLEAILNQGNRPLAWIIVSNIIQQVIGTFMGLGLTRVGLDVVEGRPVEVGRLFGQASKLPGALAGSILLGLLVAGPAGLVVGLGLAAAGQPTPATLGLFIGLGLLLLLVPGAYFAARLGFFQVAMVDRGMAVADSFRESLRLTRGNVWLVIGLYLVCLLINIGGMLLLCVGLIFTIPLTTLAWYVAYKWMLHGEGPLLRIHGR
jgi:hypothetical protein